MRRKKSKDQCFIVQTGDLDSLSLSQLQVTRKSSGSHFQFKETGSPPSVRFFYSLSILPVGTAFLVLQVTRSLVRRSPLPRTFVSPSSPTAALTAPPHPGVLRLHLWGIPPDRPPPDVFLSQTGHHTSPDRWVTEMFKANIVWGFCCRALCTLLKALR